MLTSHEDSLNTETLGRSVGAINVRTFQVLQCSWVSFLGDSCLERKPNKIIMRFYKKFAEDPVGLISHYSGLAHMIRKSLIWVDGEVSIDSFLVDMQKTPIFREYLHFYNTRDMETLRYILSFLELGKKTTYVDASLDTTAFRGWYEVEQRLSQLELPSWTDNLRPVIEAICANWEFRAMLPKHGSGAVADRGVYGVRAKNSHLNLPKKIAYLYYSKGYYDTTWDTLPFDHSENQDKDVLHISRLFFVPKTYKTSRSICMEPVPYMYAQQSVRFWLERAISDGILSDFVTLKDQGTNQKLCRHGSIFGSVDTIDLSSASDSVSWDLVKTIFPPKILKHLLATRSRDVNVADVVTVRVKKFAPMGSAVCFPTQSIIYAAIVIYISICKTFGLDWKESWDLDCEDVLRMFHKTYPRKGSAVSHDLSKFACYGDDIICDSRITTDVIQCLGMLGFSVNSDKSFRSDSCFRESCGKEYAAGHDVTPFRLKLRTLGPEVSIETVGGLIDQINLSYLYGYTFLRRHLIQYVLHASISGYSRPYGQTKNEVLFSEDPDSSFSIFHSAPTNKHLKIRLFDYNPNNHSVSDTRWLYQRDEVRSIYAGVVKKKKLSVNDEFYRYTAFWRAKTNQRVGKDIEDDVVSESIQIPTYDALGVGIRRRWTAVG